MTGLSDLARVIIDQLLEDGMTRKGIAEKTGVSYSSLYNVMSGGEASVNLLESLLGLANLELIVRKRK